MDINSAKKFVVKNRITVSAVLAFAVALGCVFAFAGNNSETLDASSVPSAESSVSISSDTLSGNGIFVDGVFVSAVSDRMAAEAAIDSILASRVEALEIASEDVSFANKIEVLEGAYPSESFVDIKSLFDSSNGTLTDYNGNNANLKLSVRSVSEYHETVVVEHDVKTVYTNAIANGAKKILAKGFDGEGIETHSVVSLDGVEIEHNVSLNVTTAPVAEVVRVGTRSTGRETQSLGTFIKPYDGYITSYVGSRWGRHHNGLDIVELNGSCFRDPAVAAGDGVVVKAERHAGFGNYVVIDHGNGIETLYAHFDSITVSVGDVVSAGDVVGLIGSTGRSTGPHLHFEVHVDGEVVNPLLFVDYE